MRSHTAEDIEYDLGLLWEYEGEGLSQAALAEREGMSQGHLSRRLARARRYRQRWRDEQRLAERPDANFDRYDYPYMELTSNPTDPLGDWCDIESGEASRDRGKVHVGGNVRSLRGGTQTTDDMSRDDGKAQPTNYKPDPSGLKGGKG